jgi:hypothetical protein
VSAAEARSGLLGVSQGVQAFGDLFLDEAVRRVRLRDLGLELALDGQGLGRPCQRSQTPRDTPAGDADVLGLALLAAVRKRGLEELERSCMLPSVVMRPADVVAQRPRDASAGSVIPIMCAASTASPSRCDRRARSQALRKSGRASSGRSDELNVRPRSSW